ncbi:MAG TPA: hypothetical protein PK679_04565 [Methanolinea sp.]|nr:hypothetical protein [Methanolinea sp.]
MVILVNVIVRVQGGGIEGAIRIIISIKGSSHRSFLSKRCIIIGNPEIAIISPPCSPAVLCQECTVSWRWVPEVGSGIIIIPAHDGYGMVTIIRCEYSSLWKIIIV